MHVELLHVHQQAISCYSQDEIPKEGYLWLLLDKSEIAQLSTLIPKFTGKTLNERHFEDLRQANHPSFYDGMSDYEIIILRSVSDLREGSKRIFPVTTFIIFENLLVTVYDTNDKAIPKFHQILAEQKRTIPQSSIVLAEFCLGFLIDRYLDIRPALDKRLNTWQEKLLQIKAKAVD
jgi:magnesium transporter